MRRPCLTCRSLTTRSHGRCDRCYALVRNVYRDRAYRQYRAYVMRTRPVCHLCGLPGADTVDHVQAVADGGANGPDNWQPAHRGCNVRKARLPWDDL